MAIIAPMDEEEIMPATDFQAGMIESLLHTSTLSEPDKHLIELSMSNLTYVEADKTLYYLRLNQIETFEQSLTNVLRKNAD